MFDTSRGGSWTATTRAVAGRAADVARRRGFDGPWARARGASHRWGFAGPVAIVVDDARCPGPRGVGSSSRSRSARPDQGKGGRRRGIGMKAWGREQPRPWLDVRRFLPHQLCHTHPVELAREGVSLNVVQRQLRTRATLGATSIHLPGIDPEEIVARSTPPGRSDLSASAGLRLQRKLTGPVAGAFRRFRGPAASITTCTHEAACGNATAPTSRATRGSSDPAASSGAVLVSAMQP
jgi:hypothetical protein